jgi:uncharacterized protein
MTFPIFLDANVPIYATGGAHPLKDPCVGVLRLVARHPRSFLTDAEVLQELLHRYLALRRWTAGREVVREFASLMRGRVERLMDVDVLLAADLAGRGLGLSARDLIHWSVMSRAGVEAIVTADRGFDRVSEVRRLDPIALGEWWREAEA